MNTLHKLDDSSYKFFVVDFDDGYELVPRNWIIRETSECYWPDATTTKSYDRAVEAMEHPKETWKICSIKKIRARAKSFQRGKEKLKDAANRSDLSTDADALKERKSRHSRAIKRRHTSSSSSLESDEENDNILPLPKLPVRLEQQEPKKVSYNKLTRPRPSQIQSTSPSVSKKSDGELGQELRTPPNAKQNEIRSFDWSTSVTSPKEQSDGIKSILRAISGIKFTLATIVANQDEIKSRIERLEENINSKENGIILDEGIDEDVLSLLPIKCDEDFTILEENLNGVHFKKKLVIELKKIGGNELKNVVYNLLPRLLTHGMAVKYSWYGAKGKRALACSNISGLIKDIVRCHIKDATDSEIEVPVKKWLSKAKERIERDTAKKQLAEIAAVNEGAIDDPH